jgi:hypothetical protein
VPRLDGRNAGCEALKHSRIVYASTREIRSFGFNRKHRTSHYVQRDESETVSESETMTTDDYEKLPPEEKEHFAKCSECGELFDRRNLDEVLFHHTDDKHRPDIQYSGSTTL